MQAVYSILIYLIAPAVLLRLLWRSRRAPAYRERWADRIGLYSRQRRAQMQSDIWVHAVSVGEVQAAQPLIRHLLSAEPPMSVMVTTTTPTGARRLQELFGDRVQHCYTPLDAPAIMRRFFDAVAPGLVLVLETEVWPNMLLTCETRGIPVILANARLSERSARGYARLRSFAATIMGRFTLIAAQTDEDARRFEGLGVPNDRIAVTGSIKFDTQLPASLPDQAEVMRRGWGCNRPVWVAASTHEGEDEPVLAAHELILERHPQALLVLVPRHPERFDRVAGLIQRQGLTLARRSRGDAVTSATQVYLGDTMGELTAMLAAADAAFIGGSLVPIGGHNALEAAAVGIPVAIGTAVFNFAAITELLVQEGAAVQVDSAETLAACMTAWLDDATERSRIGENGLRVVERNRGALKRLLHLVESQLDRTRPG
jgi:3-deoxy-D-manno-octulosonic-acid transferase